MEQISSGSLFSAIYGQSIRLAQEQHRHSYHKSGAYNNAGA